MTNRDLFVGTLREAEFRSGAIDTAYLQRHDPVQLMAGVNDASTIRIHALVAALAAQAGRRNATLICRDCLRAGAPCPVSPSVCPSWSVKDRRCELPVRPLRDHGLGLRLATGITSDSVDISRYRRCGGRRRASALPNNPMRCKAFRGQRIGFHGAVQLERFPDPSATAEAGSLLAPMPGAVVRIEVIEAHGSPRAHPSSCWRREDGTHRAAPTDGVVAAISVIAGDQVESGQVLAVVEDDFEG